MADLADGPALLIAGEKITASHRSRDATILLGSLEKSLVTGTSCVTDVADTTCQSRSDLYMPW